MVLQWANGGTRTRPADYKSSQLSYAGIVMYKYNFQFIFYKNHLITDGF
jgi:hypothetical protein